MGNQHTNLIPRQGPRHHNSQNLRKNSSYIYDDGMRKHQEYHLGLVRLAIVPDGFIPDDQK